MFFDTVLHFLIINSISWYPLLKHFSALYLPMKKNKYLIIKLLLVLVGSFHHPPETWACISILYDYSLHYHLRFVPFTRLKLIINTKICITKYLVGRLRKESHADIVSLLGC